MRLLTIQERFRLIHAKNFNPDSIDDFGARFRIISRDLSPSSIGAIDTVEGQKKIESLIAPDTKFVVLDNYSAFSSGGSEISSA